MKRCSHPDHPHCTVWVMPGDPACAHGHVQPAAAVPAPAAADASATPSGPPSRRPHLHVSGFDPRAAGGRQLLKLEVRGMPADCPPELALLASSRLRLDGGERLCFTRTVRGDWLPVFLEFSSRGLEHGQYRIDIELQGQPDNGGARTWIATLAILAPRPDASLHEIHSTFLATHKNVRVSATDASIARVRAQVGGGSLDIDVKADNAGIAHLDLDGSPGKIDLGFASIAWDEDLLELDQPRIQLPVQPRIQPERRALDLPPVRAPQHPCPASTACLVFDTQDASEAGAPHGQSRQVRHLRLFALDEWVLGRYEPGAGAEAELLLMHHRDNGPTLEGLTRRISARHAVIRRAREGFEIEDVSRYGLLVDGAWPGKHAPVPLCSGMRLELTASIPGVAVLEVGPVLPNGLVLYRVDAGMTHEAFCLLNPEHDPGAGMSAPGLPLLFHRDGGFWQRDGAGFEARPLAPASQFAAPAGWPRVLRFATRPYPELRGASAAARRRVAGGLSAAAE
ncbi:FHA domain-containing protein [Massilia sp. SYSU DXS3249]